MSRGHYRLRQYRPQWAADHFVPRDQLKVLGRVRVPARPGGSNYPGRSAAARVGARLRRCQLVDTFGTVDAAVQAQLIDLRA